MPPSPTQSLQRHWPYALGCTPSWDFHVFTLKKPFEQVSGASKGQRRRSCTLGPLSQSGGPEPKPRDTPTADPTTEMRPGASTARGCGQRDRPRPEDGTRFDHATWNGAQFKALELAISGIFPSIFLSHGCLWAGN